MSASLREWVLDRVPMFMRSWPCLRRFYWQPEEIRRIEKRARELSKLFGFKRTDERR